MISERNHLDLKPEAGAGVGSCQLEIGRNGKPLCENIIVFGPRRI